MIGLPRGSALVVASHNKGKVREIEELLAPFSFEIKSATSDRKLLAALVTELNLHGLTSPEGLAGSEGDSQALDGVGVVGPDA